MSTGANTQASTEVSTTADGADSPAPVEPQQGGDAPVSDVREAAPDPATVESHMSSNAGPEGPPPPIRPADPDWHHTEAEAAPMEPKTARPESELTVGLGAQVFGVQGKIMSGLSLRLGEGLYWGELEFSPIWLTASSPGLEGTFIGNQWGFYFALAPLRTTRVELLAGLGLDIYHLWGIHGDEVRLGLGLKAKAQYRVLSQAWVLATLRGYPVHSRGLELGVDRSGEQGIPILGSLGVEARFE